MNKTAPALQHSRSPDTCLSWASCHFNSWDGCSADHISNAKIISSDYLSSVGRDADVVPAPCR